MTEIILIPGNHDEALRGLDIFGRRFCGIKLEREVDYRPPCVTAGPYTYDLVVVSDWHMLTKRPVAAEVKRRFIDLIDTPVIVANGDMLDGQRKNFHAPGDVAEAEKGILDSFNARAARGVARFVRPGVYGESGGGAPGDKSDVWKIRHGDDFEPEGLHLYDVAERRGTGFIRFWDSAYGEVIGACAVIGLKTRFNPLAAYMRITETLSGAKARFEKRALGWVEENGYAGIVTGHTHLPYIKGKFVNDGDGVENLTAVGFRNGRPELIYMPDYVRDAGRGKPDMAERNKAEFRAVTERQVAAIHQIWPGKIDSGWRKLLRKLDL